MRRRSLVALLKASPWAYGGCRTRWSCAPLALTWQAQRGVAVSAETMRRWLPEVGWVWQRPKLVAKDDDPHRMAQLARIRYVVARRKRCEAMVGADALAPSSSGSMSWWTIRTPRRQRPSNRGGRITPSSRGSCCRPVVRARTRPSAPLATCMTYAPAIIHGHACGLWWRRSKRIWTRMALGHTSCHGSSMSPRSPWRSSTSPRRHTPTSPHECTNLVWTDLGCWPPLSLQAVVGSLGQGGHPSVPLWDPGIVLSSDNSCQPTVLAFIELYSIRL